MRILIVSPAPPGSRLGNAISARRWARLFRRLGHAVSLGREYRGQRCDVLIALHAVKSGPSLDRLRRRAAAARIILVLTGTDLYRDLTGRRSRKRVMRSMALADWIVTLNTEAIRQVPAHYRKKVRCILQSAEAPPRATRPSRKTKDAVVAVLGHLRHEKDPLRAAFAVRRLPAASRLRVEHAGSALLPTWARRARTEMRRNPRYVWLGGLDAKAVRGLLARSIVLVHSSHMEGGANAIIEAVCADVPVFASRVPGNVGLLGRGYPGYFSVADTGSLRRLLIRMESDPKFLERLRAATRRLAPSFSTQREADGWRRLLLQNATRSLTPGLARGNLR